MIDYDWAHDKNNFLFILLAHTYLGICKNSQNITDCMNYKSIGFTVLAKGIDTYNYFISYLLIYLKLK